MRDAFSLAFPSIDWKLLGHCDAALRDAANARGQSAHDADRESYGLALVEADRLWSIAVGSLATPGGSYRRSVRPSVLVLQKSGDPQIW